MFWSLEIAKTLAKLDLDSNGNGLRSHFNDDNFWLKLGGFLLRKLWHWVSLINLRILMCIMDLVRRFVIKGLALYLNLPLCWVWIWRSIIMFEFVIVLSLILKVYHYVWIFHCVESNVEGLSLCLNLSLCMGFILKFCHYVLDWKFVPIVLMRLNVSVWTWKVYNYVKVNLNVIVRESMCLNVLVWKSYVSVFQFESLSVYVSLSVWMCLSVHCLVCHLFFYNFQV
jgi:hypothetical protein